MTTDPAPNTPTAAPTRRLLDEHDVSEVLGRYAAARDAGSPAAAASCCIDEVVLRVDDDAGLLAVVGVDDLDRVPFVMQFRSDLDITVEGDESTASSLVIAPTTQIVDGVAQGWWRTWHQEVRMVRTDVGWRIAAIDLRPILSAAYDRGWGVAGDDHRSGELAS